MPSEPVKAPAPAAAERPEPEETEEESKITLEDLRHDMGLAEPMEDEDELAEDLPLDDDEGADADYLDKPEDVVDDDDEYSRS